jgi:hypothetical protein
VVREPAPPPNHHQNRMAASEITPETAYDAPFAPLFWEFVSAVVNVIGECGGRGAQPKPPPDKVNRPFTLDWIADKQAATFAVCRRPSPDLFFTSSALLTGAHGA